MALFPTTLRFELSGPRRDAVLSAARELHCPVVFLHGGETFEVGVADIPKAFELGWMCASAGAPWPMLLKTEEGEKGGEKKS